MVLCAGEECTSKSCDRIFSSCNNRSKGNHCRDDSVFMNGKSSKNNMKLGDDVDLEVICYNKQQHSAGNSEFKRCNGGGPVNSCLSPLVSPAVCGSATIDTPEPPPLRWVNANKNCGIFKDKCGNKSIFTGNRVVGGIPRTVSHGRSQNSSPILSQDISALPLGMPSIILPPSTNETDFFDSLTNVWSEGQHDTADKVFCSITDPAVPVEPGEFELGICNFLEKGIEKELQFTSNFISGCIPETECPLRHADSDKDGHTLTFLTLSEYLIHYGKKYNGKLTTFSSSEVATVDIKTTAEHSSLHVDSKPFYPSTPGLVASMRVRSLSRTPNRSVPSSPAEPAFADVAAARASLNRVLVYKQRGAVVWDLARRIDRFTSLIRAASVLINDQAERTSKETTNSFFLECPEEKCVQPHSTSPPVTPKFVSFLSGDANDLNPLTGLPKSAASFILSSLEPEKRGELVPILYPTWESSPRCSAGCSYGNGSGVLRGDRSHEGTLRGIRIATFNILFELCDVYDSKHSRQRVPLIIKELEALNLDVIGLQEVTPWFYRSIREGSTILRSQYYWTTIPERINNGKVELAYTQVILSRFPIVDAAFLRVSKMKRCLLALICNNASCDAAVHPEKSLFLVANCHLSSDYLHAAGEMAFRRASEVRDIAAALAAPPPAEPVLMQHHRVVCDSARYRGGDAAELLQSKQRSRLGQSFPSSYMEKYLSNHRPLKNGATLYPNASGLALCNEEFTDEMLYASVYAVLNSSSECIFSGVDSISQASKVSLGKIPAVVVGDFNYSDEPQGADSIIESLWPQGIQDAYLMYKERSMDENTLRDEDTMFTYDCTNNINFIPKIFPPSRLDRILLRGFKPCGHNQSVHIFGNKPTRVLVKKTPTVADLLLTGDRKVLGSPLKEIGGLIGTPQSIEPLAIAVSPLTLTAKGSSMHETQLDLELSDKDSEFVDLFPSDHFGVVCCCRLCGDGQDLKKKQ